MKIHRDLRYKKIGVIIEKWLITVIFASFIAALIGFIAIQSAYRRFYSYKLVKDDVEDAYRHITESFFKMES